MTTKAGNIQTKPPRPYPAITATRLAGERKSAPMVPSLRSYSTA